jgi:hypothetical protein
MSLIDPRLNMTDEQIAKLRIEELCVDTVVKLFPNGFLPASQARLEFITRTINTTLAEHGFTRRIVAVQNPHDPFKMDFWEVMDAPETRLDIVLADKLLLTKPTP